MIVCLCEAVTDRILRAAVRDGAHTVRAVARATRAGTGCGACACDVRRIVREERACLGGGAGEAGGEAACAEALPLAAK